MGWENRKGRGHYYTRSRRVGGRVLRQYLGSGPMADVAAQRDAAQRAARAAQTQAWSEQRERLDAADQELDALCRLTDALMRAELTAAGYHQHARGEWRKRRGGQ